MLKAGSIVDLMHAATGHVILAHLPEGQRKRADGFNVPNHPSFSNPGTNLSGDTGQAITSTRFSALIPDARVVQVAARLTF